MSPDGSKTHYTAKELEGFPGVPNTESAIIRKSKKESWPSRPRAGRGGGREYPLSCLPEETKRYILDNAATVPAVISAPQLPAVVPDAGNLPALTTLKKWQVQAMDARLVFIRMIEQYEPTIGVSKAVKTIVKQAAAGLLSPEVQAMVPIANERAGGSRALSESTLMRWWSTYKKAGRRYEALAPRDSERAAVPPWAPFFLQCYRVPQKISVAHALEDLAAVLPAGVEMPSEHQARRFIAKFSRLDIQKGRMTGKELKSVKGFIRRDTSEFLPLDICLCDGHSWKGYIAHPVHGRPFKPEVCAVIDAVTRVITGWSAGLAESSQTVADAVRHAVTVSDTKRYGGIPAILYADRGAGNEATVNADPFIGMYARLGITYKTGIPGNSQARGLVERIQKTVWIRGAQKTITYTGNGMDSSVQRQVYLRMEKDVKQSLRQGREGKKSDLLMSWQDFLDYCSMLVEEYNRRPHASLPRFTDPETGLRRNMCPLEMWSRFLAEGWEPTVPEADELDSLFRPHVTVTTRRGEVRLFGNIYYSADLVHYGGETVVVAYDIHDAGQVCVKDMDERLIAIARWNANKKAFFPVSAVEKAREDRKQRRAKTLQNHLDEVEAEAAVAPILVEYREVSQEVIAYEQKKEEKEKEAEEARRFFTSAAEIYDDIRARAAKGQANPYEIQWADDKDASGVKRVGLYADDPACAGRFKAVG